MKGISSYSLLLLSALCLEGCTSMPPSPASLAPETAWKYKTPEAILKHEDVKGKPPQVFPKPIAEVRNAAVRALNFVGCEVKTQEAYYVSGRRPNKWGFFVGSGGETVEVMLHPSSSEETHVWVDTDLSFIGIAGQKDWNNEVLAEMRNLLGATATKQ